MNGIENKFNILKRENTLLQEFAKPSIFNYDNPLLNVQKKSPSNTLLNSLLNGNGKKKSELVNDLEMKKPKLLLNSDTNYSNLSLIKPNISLSNSLTSSHILTSNLLSKSNLNLLTNSPVSGVHVNKLKNNLLQTKSSFSIIKTVESIKGEKTIHAEFQSQSQSTFAEVDTEFTQNTSLVYDEFLKVDALIDVINKQEREHFNLNKKHKISKNNALFSVNLFAPTIPTIQTKIMQGQKNALINLVCASLLRQPNFKSKKDTTRNTLIQLSEAVINADPEFILKLALYTRRELNIRVTANFLLCLASFREECRPYLQRYFKASIMVRI